MGDANSFVLSFLLGFVGLGLLVYGKKQRRMPQLVVGVLFMVYPYFTPTVTSMLLVGVGLMVGLWWMLRMGW